MEIEQMTRRFNTAQGVVFAVVAGVAAWAGACFGIFLAVTA